MRKAFLVAGREYMAAVRSRGFLIGLVLAPLLMSGGFIAMAVFKDRRDTTTQRLAVLDRTGWVAPVLVKAVAAHNEREITDPRTGRKMRPAYEIEVVNPDEADPQKQRLGLSERVRNRSLHAFLEIGPGVLHPRLGAPESQIRYYAKNGALDDLRHWVATPINEELRRRRLWEAGIDSNRVTNLFDWAAVESLGLVSLDPTSGTITQAERRGEAEAVFLPMVAVIMLFMLIMMGATPLLQTIMEEKTQRIAEVMLGAVQPFELMLGKLLGGVAVALTGSAVYLLGSIQTLRSIHLTAFIPYHVMPWFLAFLIGAIFLFGALFAAVGSVCNDPKDAQSLQLPVMLPVIVPLFLLGPMMKEPHSAWATWLSLCPPFSPMLMLLRLTTPSGVPAWQPWVGLAGTLLFGAFSVWAGGRIFRIGILNQGKPPRFSQMLRWAWKG